MPVMTSEVRAQIATQTDFTTAATPTVALRGLEELTLRSANEIEVRGDMTTALAGGDTGMVNTISGAGSFSGWASYEHLAWFFDNLFGEATPSGTYTRAYAAPVTTAPTPRIVSIVKGDSTVGAYQLVGGLISSFTLTGEIGQPLMFSGDLIGVKLQADALEVIAAPTVNPIMSSHFTAFDLDAWAGTMGTTELVACTVRSFEFTFEPDRNARNCFGTLTAGSYVENPWMGTLAMSIEFNTASKAIADAIVAGTLTQRQVQMIATDTAARSLTLQFAGTQTDDLEVFEDDDGVVTVNFSLERTYHPTFANWFKAILLNAVADIDP